MPNKRLLVLLLCLSFPTPTSAQELYYIPGEGWGKFKEGTSRQEAMRIAGYRDEAAQASLSASTDKSQPQQARYRFVTLPSGERVATPENVSDEQLYRQLGLPVPPPPTPIDYTGYKWGILFGTIGLFLLIDVFANAQKPLPPGKRWGPAGGGVGALGGIAYVALESTYKLEGGDAQKIADLTFHPLAFGIGTVIPAFLGVLVVWYFYRRKLYAAGIGVSGDFRNAFDHRPPRDTSVPRVFEEANAFTTLADPFEVAGNEVLSGNMKAGLWARALAEGNENEYATRAVYVRLRVAELESES